MEGADVVVIGVGVKELTDVANNDVASNVEMTAMDRGFVVGGVMLLSRVDGYAALV